MKAIMISIKPKYVAKILNGEKTIEIRKTMPKCDLPIDVYIYCTKDNRKLLYSKILDNYALEVKHDDVQNSLTDYELNGKVVAKFTLKEIKAIKMWATGEKEISYMQSWIKSCLEPNEFDNYIKGDNTYAWHISNLEIFDKPRTLKRFCKVGFNDAVDDLAMDYLIEDDDCPYEHAAIKLMPQYMLTKAPQSWCYVEVDE